MFIYWIFYVNCSLILRFQLKPYKLHCNLTLNDYKQNALNLYLFIDLCTICMHLYGYKFI